jgi:hypothetical protein
MYHLDGPTQLLSHNQSQPFIVIQNHQNTLLISTYLHHLPFAASVPSLKLNCIFLLMQKLEFRGFQTDQHRFLHSTVPFLISLITHSLSLVSLCLLLCPVHIHASDIAEILCFLLQNQILKHQLLRNRIFISVPEFFFQVNLLQVCYYMYFLGSSYKM